MSEGKTAAQLLVECLQAHEVEYVFGVPGEENLDFLDALKESDIKFVLTRHEQGAGFMAATYGRLTGKVGVALSTLGPGATNFMTAAAYAQLGAMPMMMITGQKPILGSKQGRFQIVNIVDMMQPVTNYAAQIVHGERIPTMVMAAVRAAQQERPGAVHLELPEDIAAQAVSAQAHAMAAEMPRRPIAEEKAIQRAAQMIHAAKHPLILVGAGANRKRIGKRLDAFIAHTGIPFINTQMGKGAVSEAKPEYIGTAALSQNDYVHCAIERADLIINIGHDVVEKPPFVMHDGGPQVIHVDFSPAGVDPVYFPQHEVIGDIAEAVWHLEQEFDPAQVSWDFAYFHAVRDEIAAKLAEKTDSDAFPMKPQRYVADVRSVMGDEDIVALDNGIYKLWFARSYKTLAPNTLLLDNALATMGAGLPSAIAAKMVHPERKVLAIAGDGGFMMNSQELETAVRLGLDLVVLVLNNGSYGMIKWKQSGSGFGDFGLDFQNPDFVNYAEAYGAHGHTVTDADAFKTILERAFAAGGVHVIDVPVDDSEHAKVLTDEIRQKVCLV